MSFYLYTEDEPLSMTPPWFPVAHKHSRQFLHLVRKLTYNKARCKDAGLPSKQVRDEPTGFLYKRRSTVTNGPWSPRKNTGDYMELYHKLNPPKPVQADRVVGPKFLRKSLGEHLAAFTRTVGSAGVYPLKDLKVVASYSWIDEATPTIGVPSFPRVWKDVQVARVPADTGVQLIDQNALRMGDRSPLLPLFAAIDSLHKDFRYSDFDLVTDRSNLRKLLRFAKGIFGGKGFRIDVDLVNTTCLFTRCEARNSETIFGCKGFRHEYEQAATSAAICGEKASGHHRIVSYSFGGIKILLRFAADTCTERDIEDDSGGSLVSSSAQIGDAGDPAPSLYESPIPSVPGLTVRLTKPTSLVPQSDIVSIRTMSSGRPMDWNTVYAQLYLSQIAHLYIARHEGGSFQPVEKFGPSHPRMNAHAMRIQKSMGSLRVLLGDILQAVRMCGTKDGTAVAFALVSQGNTLTLYRRKGARLGKAITSRFGNVNLPP